MLESVRSILSSDRPDEAISGELAELLGFDELDLVTDILNNRGQFFEGSRPRAIDGPTLTPLPPKGKGKDIGELYLNVMQGITYATVSDPRSLDPDQVRRRIEEQLQANASRPLFTGIAVSHTASPGYGPSRIKLKRAARKTIGDSTSRIHFSLERRWRGYAFSVRK